MLNISIYKHQQNMIISKVNSFILLFSLLLQKYVNIANLGGFIFCRMLTKFNNS